MVTSAIFAPNPVQIMDYLSCSNSPVSADNSSLTTRATHPPLVSRNAATSTPIGPNNSRARFICVHAAPSPLETFSSASTNNGSIYVMVTADSKGQLKLLVNRYHR